MAYSQLASKFVYQKTFNGEIASLAIEACPICSYMCFDTVRLSGH